MLAARTSAGFSAAAVLLVSTLAAAAEPVKVYILAGQSNMEGKAKLSLLETQMKRPETRGLFEHLQTDGKWTERSDVWIKFFDRKGPLTIGYGSPNCIGPELEFGHVIGEKNAAQVLLIKTAWGGRSLYRDFRPPSAKLPPEEALAKMLAAAQVKKPETTRADIEQPFGESYRAMLKEVDSTLSDLKSHFPAYAGQGHTLAGFIWFQGWNDMISAEATAEYTSNLAHLIRDVRKDLKSPHLPFVIAEMGVDGPKAGEGVQKFKAAQAAVMNLPEFHGNVAVVKTDVLWDMEADAVFRKGWKQNIEEWNTVGSDFPYHYLGSAKFHVRLGKALAEAALELEQATAAGPAK